MRHPLLLAMLLLAVCTMGLKPAPTVYHAAEVQYDIHLEDDKMSWLVRTNISTGDLIIRFKDKWIRTDFKSMFLDQVTIMEGDRQQGLVLISKIGSKEAYPMQADDLADQRKTRGGVTITKGSQTKKILGYDCKEAFVKTGLGEQIHVFYTEQIKPHNADSPYTIKELAGFPLEMHLIKGTYKLDLKAEKVNVSSVSHTHFSLSIPKGYDQKTYADFKAMKEARAKGSW